VPGTYRWETPETSQMAGFYAARKGNYPLPAVPTFNVTGQYEGSVRREIKIVDWVTSGFAA
jgi:hypothetical protein